VPGFRKWLIDGLESMQDNPDFATLRHSLSRLDSSNWFENNRVSLELQRDLVPLCAHYLLEAKQHKEPRDSVARFHLRNGARLERINWLADTSSMGMQRSAGLMTNYVYRLAEVERNHELYSREFKITSSRAIEMLAKRFSNGSIITSRKSG
jgi:malonyl-CoA decarboxylase